MTKVYDLSQPLNQETPFWPLYPPFEVKFIKRKPEHGVNAMYIQTAMHIGTHLDAPLHFVTNGKTIDQIPLEWLYGPGIIVDVSEVGDLGIYTEEIVERNAKVAGGVKDGDILVLYTGWSKYAWYQKPKPEGTADEERYIHMHPGPTRAFCEYLLRKKIHVWGLDAVSTDHPMNLPIGRFLPRVSDKVRAAAAEKFGEQNLAKLFPPEDYQVTHNILFPRDCIHMENLGGQIEEVLGGRKAVRTTIGCFPFLFKGGEAAFARVVAFDFNR
jgi:kynurenine formamidase